jgi:hypothetical protein
MFKECCTTCNILKNLRGEIFSVFEEDVPSFVRRINQKPSQMGSNPLKGNRWGAEDYDKSYHHTEIHLSTVTSAHFPAKLKSTVGFMP